MKNSSAVLAGALLSAAWVVPTAMAQPACVAASASVPLGANTSDRSAPFFIDTNGPGSAHRAGPTRNPSNPNYPRATELTDGTLPSAGAEGNFIIGPTHTAAPETIAHDNVPHGTVYSFTISSTDSVIYNPGMVRDDHGELPQRLRLRVADGAGRPFESDIAHEPPGKLDAHDRRICSRAICPRHRRSVHRFRRRRSDRLLSWTGPVHHSRQPDPAAPSADHDRHRDRCRRTRRPGKRARA
jgi:hypothetical protein